MMIRWPGMRAFDMLVLKKTGKKLVDVDRSDIHRWRVHRIHPITGAGRLLGVQWLRADGRRDTVHRLRFGLWWSFEVAWWSRAAWKSLTQ